MKNVSEIKMACDPDLLINLINSDQAHIARAKAKSARVERERRKAAARERADANICVAAGICTGAIGLVSIALALTMV